MQILIFDVWGMFAHFRKYYTNSSSLTYSVPPRTTIAGMVASMLGYDRDSYYEVFNRDNMNIAVKKLTANRRIIQSLNYIKADSVGKLFNPENHTQIPFEVLTDDCGVGYRIYLHHNDDDIFNDIVRRIKEKRFVYAPYLGAAPFNCSINYVELVENANKIISYEQIDISTVINTEYIVPNTIDVFSEIVFIREKMPSDFNSDRTIKSTDSYIFDNLCRKVTLKLNREFYNIKYRDIEENIVFM